MGLRSQSYLIVVCIIYNTCNTNYYVDGDPNITLTSISTFADSKLFPVNLRNN